MSLGWGSLAGKVSSWFSTRRESLNNSIDNIKKEMEHVQNTKPFDSKRYDALTVQLLKAESLEKRASE